MYMYVCVMYTCQQTPKNVFPLVWLKLENIRWKNELLYTIEELSK